MEQRETNNKQIDFDNLIGMIINYNIDWELIEVCNTYFEYEIHCKKLFIEKYPNKEEWKQLKEVFNKWMY